MIRLLCCAGIALVFGLVPRTPATTEAHEKTMPKTMLKTMPTVVHVDEMCGGCVKKVHRRFDDDEKVGRFECDVDDKTVTFHPPKGESLSARYLWVEMDEIGKTPIKLVSPNGIYRSKPKR
ncbi:hypothetical protein [Rubinisphaera margarita]|uniref:hypothetical protein n=1 Tax=Rubinisphaera margarita TaxID=2909586 RepID=UPI001EE8A03E|nr:hypothetical protein [Rubinisphaera margarita]MCG6158240.1 hypothetical protein [Rubinisphaera margarita]